MGKNNLHIDNIMKKFKLLQEMLDVLNKEGDIEEFEFNCTIDGLDVEIYATNEHGKEFEVASFEITGMQIFTHYSLFDELELHIQQYIIKAIMKTIINTYLENYIEYINKTYGIDWINSNIFEDYPSEEKVIKMLLWTGYGVLKKKSYNGYNTYSVYKINSREELELVAVTMPDNFYCIDTRMTKEHSEEDIARLLVALCGGVLETNLIRG